MLRIVSFLPFPDASHVPLRECACCGGHYTVKRRAMRLFSGGTLEGEICPDCVLAGPVGAAGKVRERMAAGGRSGGAPAEGAERGPWIRLLDRRARLLGETSSFSLAARQTAARETRERR
jgi:hypothetical protein